MDYSGLSDEELNNVLNQAKNEYDARLKSKREKEKIQRVGFAKFVMENREKFLEVMNHSRTSCSDENPCNPGRCRKCDFMELDPQGWEWGEYGFYFDSCLELVIVKYI
tara:strand:+ start:33308 stop:33631 length:324 start_codon:yes stop_codon:yes gene_type:complete